MVDDQLNDTSPDRQITRLLIVTSIVVGLLAFASACFFVLQQNNSLEEFLAKAGVVFIVGTPILLTPTFLDLRNSLLKLTTPERLVEVVLSTRVMKRFGIVFLAIPVFLLLYFIFLEDTVRETWVAGPISILFKVLLAWSFSIIQILEFRQFEKQHFEANAAIVRESSLGRFVLRLLPSAISFMAASLSFFAGLFCAIYLSRILFVFLGVISLILFYFLGRSFSKRLGAQFNAATPTPQTS